ncbi:MAG TPA: FliM/FliN family flagellar motor switch protein [Gammaproteobacteria bacterium]|nr:FliM/FliN family flagellar motor switch protein [Gammaproteobacteria bacterium]
MAADSPKAAAAPRADITGAEVDALLVKDSAAAAPAGTPQPYDLVARDRIVRGRMPVLDRLNERWVTDFERKLGELIRQPLEVTLQEVQLAPYGNWLAALPVPTSFNLYTVKPWPRNALVAVDGKLLFALVNSYYGGTRAKPNAARETLTPTEQRLNKIVIEMLVALFRSALSPVATLEFQHVQSDVNASYLNMATPSETVVVTRVEVTLKEQGGSIALLLPLSSFDPVRDKLAEGLKTVSAETLKRWRDGLRAQLEHTELDLTSVFLETEVSMRELLQMKPGDILPIEMPKTALLRSGSRPLLRGKFGLSRGYNAVSVLEAVKSPSPLSQEKPR